MPPAHLILVRGHPGSGKTTWAKALQAQQPGLLHLENDQWFTQPDGTYRFDLARHQQAKDECLDRTRKALAEGTSVVVSNTFTTQAELAPYLAVARQTGSAVKVYEMHGQFANTHAVPEAVVQAKRDGFEPYLGAIPVYPRSLPRARPRVR